MCTIVKKPENLEGYLSLCNRKVYFRSFDDWEFVVLLRNLGHFFAKKKGETCKVISRGLTTQFCKEKNLC